MIKKLKSEIIASYKAKKINVFFLFLISAFIILIFSKLSKDYTNTLAFDIEKLNVPQENIILKDSVKLNVTIKANGFKWLQFYLSKPKISIDFNKDVYKKEGVFVWSKSVAYLKNTQFDKHIELLSISPDTLLFKYGTNLVKKVPVKIDAHVHFSPGYDMSSKVISEPDSIVIVGPNLIVSKIDFLSTEQLSIKDVRSDISTSINLVLPKKKSDLKFSNTKVLLKAKVEKFTEGTLNIPVTIINKPIDISLKFFPKTVNVSYSINLSDYSKITTKDFKVVCDYEKISDNQTFLIPEFVKVPEQVKNAKINQQRIEFIITK